MGVFAAENMLMRDRLAQNGSGYTASFCAKTPSAKRNGRKYANDIITYANESLIGIFSAAKTPSVDIAL